MKGRITPLGRARRIVSHLHRMGFALDRDPDPVEAWDTLSKLIAKEFRSQRDADNSKWRESELLEAVKPQDTEESELPTCECRSRDDEAPYHTEGCPCDTGEYMEE